MSKTRYRITLIIALYIFTLSVIVSLTASVWTLGHDLKVLNSEIDELNGQIDILTETIEMMEEDIILIEPEHPTEIVEEELPKLYTDEDATVLAKMLWGEARGIKELNINGRCVSGKCQQAAVIWTALNRYDAGYSDSIVSVVTAPKQFVGYRESNPVDEELMDLVIDVLDRWNKEKHGENDVGRVLPADYLWFYGDGKYNHFKNEYKTSITWAWELEDVYGE